MAGSVVRTSITRPDFGSSDMRGEFQARAGAVENPVVIVAAAELDLLVICVDALADGVGLAEIEGRAVDFAQLAGGDQAGIDGREAVRVDGEDMI